MQPIEQPVILIASLNLKHRYPSGPESPALIYGAYFRFSLVTSWRSTAFSISTDNLVLGIQRELKGQASLHLTRQCRVKR